MPSTPQPDESAADLIARGDAMVERNWQFAEGIPFYQRAAQVEPTNFDAWYSLASAHFFAGRPPGALAAYDRALTIDPHHRQAWTSRGIVLGMLGRHDEALAAYDRALDIRPNGLGWTQRARTLRTLGREAEAQEAERHAQQAENWL